ncbi:hypothetical protein QQP08_025916 [Theobroma cacao]|nr:hypothetical protein QQP08_025916 [Theobroma cacao]
MEPAPNDEEPTSWDELYNIDLMPSELFLKFIKEIQGFRVGVNLEEVREFFTRAYGDCIESLHMQEVPPDEQSLFARIVFRSESAIEIILSGMSKAKFTINGKHVWTGKFVPKRLKPSLPPTPPVNLPV